MPESRPKPFADAREHLFAELERVDLLIRSRVAHVRRLQPQDDHLRGLYITEQDVDRLLARPTGAPSWLGPDEGDGAVTADLDARLAELGRRLAQRAEATRAAGLELPLVALARLFGLEPFDVDVLLVCLASEIDLRYEKLYAYLQDDVTRRRPGIELAIQLLTPAPAARLAMQRRFLPDAPLLAHQVVQLIDEPEPMRAPLLARSLRPDPRIAQFVFGVDAIDDRLRASVTVVRPEHGLDGLLLDDDRRTAIRRAWPTAAGTGAPPVVVLTGGRGAGKRSTALALCAEHGLTMLGVALAAWPASADAFLLARLVEREALLHAAAVHWDGTGCGDPAAHAASTEGAETPTPPRRAAAVVARCIDAAATPTFWAAEAALSAATAFPGRGAVVLEIVPATHQDRAGLWRARLAGVALAADVDLDALGSRFRMSPGAVVQAAADVRWLARSRAGRDDDAAISMAELRAACRAHSNQKLGALAHKTTSNYRWDDIVLPSDCLAQLREICNHVRLRDRVYGDWGFGRKLQLGKGLAVLFAGPSGTGKTMSAGIIAAELGLDLYKIDLSTVISKFIGETEKNLAAIFDEAETSNAILFFDEADALFGKRSEVRDSHDRYANVEVGYLLQRMEEYEGIAILATNLRKNMDDAFVRRLHFTVEFPLPDVDDRLRIWQAVWPEPTPRDAALDLALLAGQYEMTGGNIKNVAVAAAFLAAAQDDVVRMGHVLQATRREYQKTGKLIGDADDRILPTQ